MYIYRLELLLNVCCQSTWMLDSTTTGGSEAELFKRHLYVFISITKKQKNKKKNNNKKTK